MNGLPDVISDSFYILIKDYMNKQILSFGITCAHKLSTMLMY